MNEQPCGCLDCLSYCSCHTLWMSWHWQNWTWASPSPRFWKPPDPMWIIKVRTRWENCTDINVYFILLFMKQIKTMRCSEMCYLPSENERKDWNNKQNKQQKENPLVRVVWGQGWCHGWRWEGAVPVVRLMKCHLSSLANLWAAYWGVSQTSPHLGFQWAITVLRGRRLQV